MKELPDLTLTMSSTVHRLSVVAHTVSQSNPIVTSGQTTCLLTCFSLHCLGAVYVGSS